MCLLIFVTLYVTCLSSGLYHPLGGGRIAYGKAKRRQEPVVGGLSQLTDSCLN
jgi:hypothetical protein